MCGSAAIWMQIQLLWRKKKINFSVFQKKLFENCVQLNDAANFFGFFLESYCKQKAERKEKQKGFFSFKFELSKSFPIHVQAALVILSFAIRNFDYLRTRNKGK